MPRCDRLRSAFERPALLAELLAARAAEEGAAALDDAAHVARAQRLDGVVDQALKAVADAEHLHAPVEGAARDGADGGVHARGVAAARQDCDALHEPQA